MNCEHKFELSEEISRFGANIRGYQCKKCGAKETRWSPFGCDKEEVIKKR